MPDVIPSEATETDPAVVIGPPVSPAPVATDVTVPPPPPPPVAAIVSVWPEGVSVTFVPATRVRSPGVRVQARDARTSAA